MGRPRHVGACILYAMHRSKPQQQQYVISNVRTQKKTIKKKLKLYCEIVRIVDFWLNEIEHEANEVGERE